MNISPEEAVEVLEACMNRGYETLDSIRTDCQEHISNVESRKEHWSQLWGIWVSDCLKKLQETYNSPSRAYNFRETKTTRYAMSNDLPYTGFENDINAKIQVLKGYYDFIMRQGHPSITVNGDLNFQLGENISYEKK